MGKQIRLTFWWSLLHFLWSRSWLCPQNSNNLSSELDFCPSERELKLCKNSQGKSEKYSHDLCFHEHQEHKKSYNFSVGQVLPLYFVKEFPVHSLDFPKQTWMKIENRIFDYIVQTQSKESDDWWRSTSTCRVIIDVNHTNKALLAFCSFGVTYIINTNESRMLEISSKMNENSFNCFNRVNWVIWERPKLSPGRHACWSSQRDLSILSNQVTLNRILLGYLKSISD